MANLPTAPLDLAAAIKELTPLIKDGRLNAFVGAGISKTAPSSLPLWSELLEQIIAFFGELIRDQASTLSEFGQLKKLLKDAKHKDSDTIEAASALRDALVHLDSKYSLGLSKELEKWLLNKFAGKAHNSLHTLIVKVDFSHILTTNYDDLLEQAAKAISIPLTELCSIDYTETSRLSGAIYTKHSAVIHVHGTTRQIPLNEFVFSAADYAKMLDKQHRGFATLLRSLFLTHSTLFLGYGGLDPHIEALVEELSLHTDYQHVEGMPIQYEVALASKINQIYLSGKNRKRTRIIQINDYNDYDTLLKKLGSSAPRIKRP